jgi:hypothetical protein
VQSASRTVAALAGLVAAAVGVIALRRNFYVGVAGIAVFGAIGAWAALSRRTSAPVHVALPSVVGALAGIGALWLVHDRLFVVPAPASPPVDGVTDRRQFFRSTGAVLGALGGVAALTGAAGRRLASRFSASESRADVVLPPPTEPLPALPATVQADVRGMTPFITPNADFYRIDTALVAPQVPADSYVLKVIGMVDNELELRRRADRQRHGPHHRRRPDAIGLTCTCGPTVRSAGLLPAERLTVRPQ